MQPLGNNLASSYANETQLLITSDPKHLIETDAPTLLKLNATSVSANCERHLTAMHPT